MTNDTPEQPSQLVISQRYRNSIVSYLETASSYAKQKELETYLGWNHTVHEIINQWEDWVQGDNLDWFKEPVFSLDEQSAIREFHAIWESVASTPNKLPRSSKRIGTETWERLRLAAEKALGVFTVRGRFHEEQDRL